jgi:hypothetical protein
MTMGGPAVKMGAIYASTLDTFNLDSPQANYKARDGLLNFGKAIMRHGLGIYVSIMERAFNPAKNRESSLALPETYKPATRFPLAEDQRPSERSENNAIAFSGGYNLNGISPLENTVAIYDAGSQEKKKDRPYQPYSKQYKKEEGNNPAKKGEGIKYKISSMVKALEDRAKKYMSKFYVALGGDEVKLETTSDSDDDDILSMPTLEQYQRLVRIKKKRSTSGSSLEEMVSDSLN